MRSVDHTSDDEVVHILVLNVYGLGNGGLSLRNELSGAVVVEAVNDVRLVADAAVCDSIGNDCHLERSHTCVLVSDSSLKNVTDVPYESVLGEGLGVAEVAGRVAGLETCVLTESV